MRIFLRPKKFKYFLGVLDIPNFFFGGTQLILGPILRMKKKWEYPPPPPPHTHTHYTHSPWVTVYEEKLLAWWSVIADWVISGCYLLIIHVLNLNLLREIGLFYNLELLMVRDLSKIMG